MNSVLGSRATAVAVAVAIILAAGCDKNNEKATVPNNLLSADGVPANVADSPSIDNALVSADPLKTIRNTEYILKGIVKFDGWFIKADTLIFEPGAQLVFSRTALSNRRQFWVVAKRIEVRDAGNPGVITWEKGDVPTAPQAPGEAPSGAGTNESSAPGGLGGSGAKGALGSAGANAPQITLVVTEVPGSGVIVDLTGGGGGQGGPGMKGGRGGVGGPGVAASQTAFDCRRGAGDGGAGGQGGPGGEGGEGGTGGAGGNFLLVSQAQRLASLTQKFRVKVAAGTGGPAGLGGPGGEGGPGGHGGQDARPYCVGNGSTGRVGSPGVMGAAGAAGGVGQEGDFTVGGVTQAQLDSYIWPSK